MKTIGIIGGMGPQATVDLYEKIIKLTPANKDQEHLHVMIDSYSQIPDRTACILGNGQDPVPFLKQAAMRLEQAGADALCMPCNTAHYFLPQVSHSVSIPFISIIESAVNCLHHLPQKASKIFVMATTGTQMAKVYENQLIEQNFEVLTLPQDVQADLMYCIYEGVKKGRTQEVIPLFQSVLDRLIAFKPDALIAACTELPLLTVHTQCALPIVDATYELAKACVEFGLEKKIDV